MDFLHFITSPQFTAGFLIGGFLACGTWAFTYISGKNTPRFTIPSSGQHQAILQNTGKGKATNITLKPASKNVYQYKPHTINQLKPGDQCELEIYYHSTAENRQINLTYTTAAGKRKTQQIVIPLPTQPPSSPSSQFPFAGMPK